MDIKIIYSNTMKRDMYENDSVRTLKMIYENMNILQKVTSYTQIISSRGFNHYMFLKCID